MGKKYETSNLFLKGHKYDKQYKNLDDEKSELQPKETIAEGRKLMP